MKQNEIVNKVEEFIRLAENQKLNPLKIVKSSHQVLDHVPYFPGQYFSIRNFHLQINDNHKKHFLKPNEIISIRNDITEFSSRSSKRMKLFLSQIDYDFYKTKFFFTVTFGKTFPQTKIELKKYLEMLLKRLERLDPNLFLVWRVELQKRNAPHFHLLLFFPSKFTTSELQNLTKKIKTFWNEITKEINPNSENVNSDLRSIYTYNVLSYISKYLSKQAESDNLKLKLGRFWGKRGKLIKAKFDYYTSSKDFQNVLKTFFISELNKKINLKKEYYDYLQFSPRIDICLNQLKMFDLILKTIKQTSEIPYNIETGEAITTEIKYFCDLFEKEKL